MLSQEMRKAVGVTYLSEQYRIELLEIAICFSHAGLLFSCQYSDKASDGLVETHQNCKNVIDILYGMSRMLPPVTRSVAPLRAVVCGSEYS